MVLWLQWFRLLEAGGSGVVDMMLMVGDRKGVMVKIDGCL
jgi:hypothetical protein